MGFAWLTVLLCYMAIKPCVSDAQLNDEISVSGETLRLVWQDEFNEAAGTRSFGPGEDPVWEGVDLWYMGTWDDEVYKPTQAEVANGRLKVTLDDVPGWDRHHHRMHKFTSAMLQSWNKLCYTGGYFEVRAKQPGNIDKGGQWSAAWMAGNLGRPGYLSSTGGTWPYSYNQCDGGEKSQVGLDDGTWLGGQRITACNATPGFGLNPNQGRGMPEFDVLEVSVPTHGAGSGQNVHLTASLQMGPLIPKDTNFGPGLTGCQGSPMSSATYEQCESFQYLKNQSLPVKPAHWCMVVDYNENLDLWDRASALQDCLSAEVQLNAAHFEEFHTYGVLWEPQERMVWFVDGKPVYEVKQSALEPKRSPSNPDFYVGQRDIPTEPVSLILNLAISDGGFQMWNRDHVWPLEFEVDYVRIYQDPNRGHSLGCSPTSHPTAEYIAAHSHLYGIPECGNQKCDDLAECTTCPGDCAGNMACPSLHIDGVPKELDGWELTSDVATCPGTCGTAVGGRPLGCCFTGDCCTAINGGPIGCAVGHCGSEAGCEISFTQNGMRIRAAGAMPCMLRRTGLLPEGPLQATRDSDFSLSLLVEGNGAFQYAITVGPHGTMCDPAYSDCKSILVKQDPDETAICPNCEGNGTAPGNLHQRLGHIDLSFRFPYFLGPHGGALKLTVEPGADIIFRQVRFGPFNPAQDAIPLAVTRRGFWSTHAACAAVAAAPACDSVGTTCHTCGARLAWLMSPAGGSQASDVAQGIIASEFPAECGACDTSVVLPFDIHHGPASTVTTKDRVTTSFSETATVTETVTSTGTATTITTSATPVFTTSLAGATTIVANSTSYTLSITTLVASATATTAATDTSTITTMTEITSTMTVTTISVTTSPTFTATTAIVASTTQNNAACSAHPTCSGLMGSCCPTPGNTHLSCCSTSTPNVPFAACSAHPACSGLAGNCCPSQNGIRLGCCSDQPWAGAALVFTLGMGGGIGLRRLQGVPLAGLSNNVDFRASCRSALAAAYNSTFDRIEVLDISQVSYNAFRISFGVLAVEPTSMSGANATSPSAAVAVAAEAMDRPEFKEVFGQQLVRAEITRPGGLQGLNVQTMEAAVAPVSSIAATATITTSTTAATITTTVSTTVDVAGDSSTQEDAVDAAIPISAGLWSGALLLYLVISTTATAHMV